MNETVIAILTSGAIFSFVQFIITFGFSRSDKYKEIEKKIDDLGERVDKVSDQIDENAAILARTHILRFNDELRNGVEHSNEYFRQQLDDCDTYNKYCDKHKDFKNSYTMIADKNIKDTYDKLCREGKL